MPKASRKRIHKSGLPPGTPVHTGERLAQETRISWVQYDAGLFDEKTPATIEECLVRRDGKVTWVDVSGVHDTGAIERIGQAFGLHPLVIEDIANTDQRAKVEDYGDYVFIVLKRAWFKDPQTLAIEQVSIIVGRDFVLSFQEGPPDDFAAVRARLESGKARVREHPADYLGYMLLDVLVDDYFGTLERFDERLEDLETELTGDPTRESLTRLHALRRELVFLLRAVWPLREVIGTLERGELGVIRPETRVYLRDVHDHTLRVMDTVETLRELVSGMVEIYLSSSSNRINEIIKVLTILSTVFLPLTFVTGWYGMNFEHMPELGWPWAYPIVIAVMVGTVLVMLAYFKRKNWI